VATNRYRGIVTVAAGAFALGVMLALASPAAAAGPDSQRLARAKDYIADEQWARAVDELRAALQDPKEPAPDEARFWLAHSLNHLGRTAEALRTIESLEEQHPKSRWVSPARSLRIEIAHNLRRETCCGASSSRHRPRRPPLRARRRRPRLPRHPGCQAQRPRPRRRPHHPRPRRWPHRPRLRCRPR